LGFAFGDMGSISYWFFPETGLFSAFAYAFPRSKSPRSIDLESVRDSKYPTIHNLQTLQLFLFVVNRRLSGLRLRLLNLASDARPGQIPP